MNVLTVDQFLTKSFMKSFYRRMDNQIHEFARPFDFNAAVLRSTTPILLKVGTVNGWFPSINSKGSIVSGAGELFLDGQSLGPGTMPRWVTDSHFIYNDFRVEQTVLVNVESLQRLTVGPAYNQYSAGSGKWAGLLQSNPTVARLYKEWEQVERQEVGGGLFVISPTTGKVAWSDNFSGDTHKLWLDNELVDETRLMNWPALTDNHLAWVDATGTYSRDVKVTTPDGPRSTSIQVWEDATIVEDDAGNPWVLSVVQTGLMFRRAFQTKGFFWAGEWFTPTIRWVDGRFLLASCSANGTPFIRGVFPDAPMIDLTTVPDPFKNPPKPQEPTKMDMPRDVYDILAAVARKFKSMHLGDDDQRRIATERGVQTLQARGFTRWVCKAGGPGNPKSKDAVAAIPDGLPIENRRQSKMFMFDTINGSTRDFNPFPMTGEEGEQWIVVEAAPKDWLNEDGPVVVVPPPNTHLYIGGGNDTNTCDQCGKSRYDDVHKIPESLKKHTYDGGEQDTGLCDICQKGKEDVIHQVEVPIPPVDPPVDPPEVPVGKHEFVGAGKFCSECGKPKTDPIHDMSVPVPGGSDLLPTLKEILASSKRQEDKLDAMTAAITKSGADITAAIKKLKLI